MFQEHVQDTKKLLFTIQPFTVVLPLLSALRSTFIQSFVNICIQAGHTGRFTCVDLSWPSTGTVAIHSLFTWQGELQDLSEICIEVPGFLQQRWLSQVKIGAVVTKGAVDVWFTHNILFNVLNENQSSHGHACKWHALYLSLTIIVITNVIMTWWW